MRDLVNIDWPKMKIKVEEIPKEVFEEVVQTELALAGLTNANLETALPQPDSNSANLKIHRSLLQRMRTLQRGLTRKIKLG